MPSRAAAANLASNSAPDRTSYTRASRPNSRAAEGSAFSVPSAAAYSGSRTAPTRENPCTASRSSSSLLPTILASLDNKNPVTLPPGRAKLSTSPSATGSSTLPNQIKGVVRVTFRAAKIPAVDPTTITAGLSATRSATSTGKRSASPSPNRYSIVAPLGVSQFAQPVPQPCNVAGRGGYGEWGHDAHHRHRRLLRPRRQRPRRRGTAQQRDELAPSHVCSLSPKVTPYHIVVWNAALCITANSAANVSVGSRASPSAIGVGLSISAIPQKRPRMRGDAICREGPEAD